MRSDNFAVRLDPGLEVLSARLAKVKTPCVLATVISAAGSTYRKPGARMLIEGDGRITGLLSGGCLEQDLRAHAASVLATGHARTVAYDMRADNDLIFGIAAGCEGCVGILLEPLQPEDRVRRAIAAAGELSRQGESLALVMIYEGPVGRLGTQLSQDPLREMQDDPLAGACARAIAGGRPQAFRWSDSSGVNAAWIEPVLALPALLICGAGPDAEPLAAIFGALHYPITVTDHRPAYASPVNFHGANVLFGSAASLGARVDLSSFFAAVVMSHHLRSDADYLRVLAGTEIDYIGVLGPRMRRMRLLAEVGRAAAALEPRLRGPIGLDIGAVTPEAIAVAVAAEIHAFAAGRNAQPLELAESV